MRSYVYKLNLILNFGYVLILHIPKLNSLYSYFFCVSYLLLFYVLCFYTFFFCKILICYGINLNDLKR